MNKAIRNTATFALLLVLALLINLTYVQAFTEDKYANSPFNKRQTIELKQTPRGQISAGGLVLAESVQDAAGLYERKYVTDPVAFGPVEGYVSDIYGTAGLEQSYNAVLDGTDPKLGGKSFKDQLLRTKTPGANLELTLNPEVQKVAYNELASRNYEGAVVAIRPSTGEILAMASTPSFNPSKIADNDTAESTWKQLTSDPGAPLLNHATQETLPPGSTFKVITTAAGLEAGYGQGSQLTAAPEITLPGTETTLENYAGMRCGPGDTASLLTAFTLSCNTAFVQMGIDVGAEKLRDMAQRFGVTEKYDLGVPFTPGTVGELADDASVGQSAIGQRDVAMTVLENAVVAATVANHGKRMKPYLVSKISSSDLATVKQFEPEELNQAIDEDVAAQLTELMRSSERHTAGSTGADIASKTGTAEHGEDSRDSNPHAWYIAFGPTEDADVAVAVVVKNGGDRGQAATGGSVAAPIGRAVIAAALSQDRR
ncbi:penicillin-binding transpeptidase domain-containing protein [Corynebacterium aquilae]|uniref:Penicillin-binding protein n=1 Tax=Corynebacterium aquilae DSM 44791 TaxID=1431546 RepID=A0A1L7CD35_9CORY|nr:penicillin-binding transpeptidase domain-containing protein [Corynebacterium aquilae]APT83762.1 penicillin-binding protein [Corynebacterium aquilae DSM 44791]